MKKTILCFSMLFLSHLSFSQKYEFQTIKDIECTPIISQGATGTCWSFSTTSFLESEIYRTSGKKIDLSEMYNVRYTYLKKAENYVLRQGKAQFGEGGLSHDVINSAKSYGIATEEQYAGKLPNQEKHDHAKMVEELETIVKKAVAETPAKYPNWKQDYTNVLDKYMGSFSPEINLSANVNFDQKNTTSTSQTPIEFLKSTKLNLDDYVTITSFTHEPFYSKFILNIPDNFANGMFYNLPLDEYIQNIDNALDKGFTLALDADVSEKTFSGKNGIAVIPNDDNDASVILTEIKPEKTITPEYRQSEFENYNTTDDHLMHIVGKAKDQKGNIYYKVKNSWGIKSGRDGFIYMSIPYMRLKSISVMLHKDGLLKKTKTNLGI
ncbi:MAG TPA: C1 family peptidase [Flavobacterium lutivivi]|nr:C1 family peptidase [Flavobacterium lutivivi]